MCNKGAFWKMCRFFGDCVHLLSEHFKYVFSKYPVLFQFGAVVVREADFWPQGLQFVSCTKEAARQPSGSSSSSQSSVCDHTGCVQAQCWVWDTCILAAIRPQLLKNTILTSSQQIFLRLMSSHVNTNSKEESSKCGRKMKVIWTSEKVMLITDCTNLTDSREVSKPSAFLSFGCKKRVYVGL